MTDQQRRAVWFGRVRDWRSSGLSQAEFCRRHDLKSTTFSAWVKRETLATASPAEVITPTHWSAPAAPVARSKSTPAAKLKPPSVSLVQPRAAQAAHQSKSHQIPTPAVASHSLPALTLVATDPALLATLLRVLS